MLINDNYQTMNHGILTYLLLKMCFCMWERSMWREC